MSIVRQPNHAPGANHPAAGANHPTPPATAPQSGVPFAPRGAEGRGNLANSPYPLRPIGPLPSDDRKSRRPDAKGREVCALVLAAGLGKRMHSRTSKLVHDVAGRPMVRHVVDATRAAGVTQAVVIVGNQAEEVRRAVGENDKRLAFVFQKEQRGTGHAVLCAERQLRGYEGDVLILNGDLPALRPQTLRAFMGFHRASQAPLSLMTTVLEDPRGYGRVIRNYAGDLSRIVEETDATPEERATREINCGIYLVDAAHLCGPLKRATTNNAQGEIYLTDLIEILHKEGRTVAAYRHEEPEEVLGVNDRRELAAAAGALYRRKARELMLSGVGIVDPDRTYIDAGVRVGRDTLIEPGAMLFGDTTVGEGARIGAGSRIVDSSIGDGTVVLPYCVIAEARIGVRCRVGPFAHLRPGSVLDEEARVGNFVETKKARLGKGSKANHLSYLGDTEVGRDANIGAGTITCNYDGVSKHRTVIEDEVFIGSDTQLVAPVRLKRGSFVAAGSTITKDVPAHALALSRARQTVKEDWALRFGPRARAGGPDGRPGRRSK
jgi:bifunctional UDP-N-acetylglucosamine pyrophosphorylase/glucosamine-1-phosphate N-acetyltransferase